LSRRTITIVILLAIVSLGLIIAGQVFWVRKAYDMEEAQFNRRVFVALSEVVQTIRLMNNDSAATEPVRQVSNNYFVANINDSPQPYLLENLLKAEFEKSNLSEDFEYGIYDCFTDSIVFGSKISFRDGYRTEKAYQIHNIENFEPDGHYFGVLFPNKSSFIIKQLDFWMYSSFVILLIVIFFSYTVFVILKQKRLAEIKTDFVNNMTHELKTPISTIGLSADALANPEIIKTPERMRQYIAIIKNENSRLRNQVDRVLQIASLTPKKVQLKNELLDLHEIINKAIGTFQVQIVEKEGTLSTELNASVAHIRGDLVHITNVVYNLLDNAVKYTEEKPKISIRTRNKGELLIVEFEDNGIGISKQHHKMVFEKFYRVPTGNLHSVRGYGLGLYYVKTIMKAHQGTIDIDSTPGKGSTFTLTFKTAR
jgi:two-component system phosphate regulon sensor histidine kinase PhoR